MSKSLNTNDMLVTITTGNIFNSHMQTIVNPINCKGIMGAGLAQRFKFNYPEMFDDYIKRCKNKEVRLGQPYVYTTDDPIDHKDWDYKMILNFPTKDHWRDDSQLLSIAVGLEYLLERYVFWDIKSIAFPALGCGLGMLKWNEVAEVMIHYLTQMNIPIEIYAPF